MLGQFYYYVKKLSRALHLIIIERHCKGFQLFQLRSGISIPIYFLFYKQNYLLRSVQLHRSLSCNSGWCQPKQFQQNPRKQIYMISYELGIRKDECRLSVSILSRIDFSWAESSPFQDIVVRYFGNFELLFLWTLLFKVTETFVKLFGGVTNCWFPRVQLKIQLDDPFFYLADPYIYLFMNYKYRAKRPQ
ncbi:Hypothetical_protein [Hexamita inflata]|uniref:Hypothetical_protein n=1 Tax=Hexamita inflata TaxID=28002 RepID=A0AA86RB53_9EUKA|nr:Hypothetical protein HINF_LOCUS27844 [Hexamita inflata]CAI9969289.1 Hypothetical protein HINF_LOCUS56934 [Hexamita inflata]